MTSDIKKKILQDAISVVCDREKVHGDTRDNCSKIGSLWSSYLGVNINSHDVAMMMVLLKVSRSNNSISHIDNYVDIAGWAACAADTISNEDTKQTGDTNGEHS